MATTVLKTIQIVSTPDVLGGKPRIEGRRISVEHVVRHHLLAGMSLEEMNAAFDLSPAEIHTALAYYYQHPDEIEASIKERESILEKVRTAQEIRIHLLKHGIESPEAAQRLNITERGVLKLIESGTLAAEKIGGRWFIDPADLERDEVKNRKRGRPPKK
jgi:excisionase family DNA binding protein